MNSSKPIWDPLQSFVSDSDERLKLKNTVQHLEFKLELLNESGTEERLVQARAELNAVEARMSYALNLTGLPNFRKLKDFDWNDKEKFAKALWKMACAVAKSSDLRDSRHLSIDLLLELACKTAIQLRNWKFFQQFEHALRTKGASPEHRRDKRKEFLLRFWAIPASTAQLYTCTDTQIARIMNEELAASLSPKEVKQFRQSLGLKRTSEFN
jgi:hypothetical protein